MSQLFVYFVREAVDGPIKIGCGNDPAKRLNFLQTGNPRRLTLVGYFPGDFSLETRLHERFAQWRLCGEWFTQDAPGLVDLAQAAGQVAKAIAGGLDQLESALADRVLTALDLSDPAKRTAGDLA